MKSLVNNLFFCELKKVINNSLNNLCLFLRDHKMNIKKLDLPWAQTEQNSVHALKFWLGIQFRFPPQFSILLYLLSLFWYFAILPTYSIILSISCHRACNASTLTNRLQLTLNLTFVPTQDLQNSDPLQYNSFINWPYSLNISHKQDVTHRRRNYCEFRFVFSENIKNVSTMYLSKLGKKTTNNTDFK